VIPCVHNTAADMFACAVVSRIPGRGYRIVRSTYAWELSPLQTSHSSALSKVVPSMISKLTNARRLPDVNRQVCLRPGFPVSLNLELVRDSPGPRHINVPRSSAAAGATTAEPGVRRHAASSAPCSTTPRRSYRRPPPFVRGREIESRDGMSTALRRGKEKRSIHS
jgi:hypothetical protein